MSSRTLLLLAIVAVAVAWQLPHGQQALYPLSLLATVAHELGHGVAALLVGGDFERLELHADGSGMAHWRGDPGPMARAFVAAGGLLGPSLAALVLLLASRLPRMARVLIALLAVLALAALVLWARNAFAIAWLAAVAVALAAAAWLLPGAAAAFLLNLIAAVLALSWLRDLDYMFSATAVVGGVAAPSDSALIAAALFPPYWLWGGVVAAASLTLLAIGLWVALRPPGPSPAGDSRAAREP